MHVSLAALLLLALLVGGPLFAHGEPISTINSSVRALGMGDAFTAVADDSQSLFYNPAGLARVSGTNWKVFGIRAGASGLEAYEKIQGLNSDSSSGYSDAIAELYGENVWSGAGGQTIFSLPMFAFGIYNHADALIRIDNPVYPEIYTSVINDYGYVMGFGAPVSPFMHIGANLKYIKRTGARVPFGASFIADLNPDTIYDNVTAWGKGYGADAGINFVVPAPFFSATVAAVWKNIGEISFRSDNPNVEIPRERNDITLGVALDFDTPILSVTPAVDVVRLNDPDLQLTRKINFGLEIGLPLLDIRGGFREGYWTYGAGLNLGLFRVDAASYGVELGAYPGQIEDRRYIVEFTMELGIGNFTASGSDSTGGKGGSGKGSSQKSIWGGTKRLKQRR